MAEFNRKEGLRAASGWWGSLSGRERSNLLAGEFPLRFSYHSGKIENDEITYHDTKEIFDRGRVVSFTGDLRTLFEISNLKSGWELVVQLAGTGARIGVDDLLRMHHRLTAGTYDEDRWSKGERPGTFKIGDYGVADDIGYSPEDTPGAVQDLLDELAEYFPAPYPSAENSFTASCYAHAMLAEIHPFSDGNGRTARALQNTILIGSELPPIIVDERDRMSYFGALDAFHYEDDLEPFQDFCTVSMMRTWGRLISRQPDDRSVDPPDEPASPRRRRPR